MRRFVYRVFLIVCLCIRVKCMGQANNSLGIGGSGGFRLNSGTFLLEYCMMKRIVISGDYSIDRYLGHGFGGGVYYHFMHKNALKPLAGIYYTRLMGCTLSYEHDDNVVTRFKVSDANYWVPTIGGRWDLPNDTTISNIFFSVFLKVGYKIRTVLEPTVVQIDGPAEPEKLEKVGHYLNNGLVASLGIIMNLPRRKHKKI
ncbi:MAG: hypothetical protein QM731_03965 [Chitinophagaceae bacterium]